MRKNFKNKDLAKRLGVSGTLVSLVLNNKADQQGIRKDTQEKVLAMARQLGYFNSLNDNNVIASVEEKPGVLGMIVTSLDHPFVTQIAPFLQKAFSDIGVGFSIITKDPDDQRYNRLVSSFKKFFSGIILVGEAADDNTVRDFKSTNYPFIVLEKSFKTLKLNTVCTDTETGSHLVVNHIEKLGYKNILIVAERLKFQAETIAIDDVIKAFSQKTGINKPVIIELDKPFGDNEIDFAHFDEFLRPPYRTDAMVIMNADIVYPIMKQLRKKKLRIPQDIAVISMEEGIGFDLMLSPVTCLRKPVSLLTTKIANMIWSEVKNSGKGKFKRQVVLPPELIIRNSCGSV